MKLAEPNAIMLQIWKLLSSTLLLIVAVIVKTYVIAKLWQWYIVPVFALPPLRLPVAYGIILIVNYILNNSKPSTNQSFINSFAISVGVALLALGLGWLGTLFM